MSEIVEVDGDTIYVIDRRVETRAIDHPHLYDTIDWLALAKQKTALHMLIEQDRHERLACGCDPSDLLDGLVNLIDRLQDDAEVHDYPVVYGYDLEMYKEDHPNAEIPDGNENQTQH